MGYVRKPRRISPVADGSLRQRRVAQNAVKAAVKRGALPDLRKVPVKCADCGERATCWDHRDYRAPLDVSPVCKGCNNRRGPGLPLPAETRYSHGMQPRAGGAAWNAIGGGEGQEHAWPGEVRIDVPDEPVDTGLVTSYDVLAAWNGGHGFRNATPGARAAYFKAHDPWRTDESVF